MKSRFLVIASLAALTGCSESKIAPVNPAGQMSFVYAGALTGSFSADGAMPVTTTDQRTMPWAAGQRDASAVFVDAAMPRSATTYDIVFLQINRTTPGSESIDIGAADVVILLGALVSGTGQPLQTCALDAGTVAITAITSVRATGTFSGTGTCLPSAGGSAAFTVTNGAFDVALLADVP